MTEVAVPTGGSGTGDGGAATAPPLHSHSVERALALPVVEAAVSQASHLYSAVRGAHPLVTWALATAERTAARAAETATPLVAPLAAPLAAADERLAAGLLALESRVPLVKQPPEVVYAAAREAIARALQPRLTQVCEARESAGRAAASLRELSWRAANDVLATHTGKLAVEGLDGGAALAQRLLDYYLPAAPLPAEPTAAAADRVQPEVVSASDDAALHSVQTVTRLSVCAAERVMAAAAARVRELRDTRYDPARYVAALLSVLHLTRLLRPDLGETAGATAVATAPAAPSPQGQPAAQ